MIRVAREADAPALAEIYAPLVAATAISFEVDPPDAGEMARRVGATLPHHPWLVCERAGRVAGYAYATRHRERAAYRWAVDVSVYVHADARRCGVGRALYAALLPILERQGFCVACAGITLPNPASVALHEGLRFRPVGVYPRVGFKLGAWHDVGWWQCELRAPEPDPPEPRPFAALGEDSR